MISLGPPNARIVTSELLDNCSKKLNTSKLE